MALIKPIHGEMKGSIAGNTFQGGASGMVVRQRRKPVNPNSFMQSERRRIMATLNAEWKATSQTTKDAFAEYAQNTPLTNKFGDSNIITGRQMFIRLHAFAFGSGNTTIFPAPATPGMAPNPEYTVSATTATGVEISGFDIDGGTADIIQVQTAGPFASSRQKHKSPWRQTQYINSETVEPFELLGPGMVSIGQVYFVAVRTMDPEGRLSEQYLIRRAEVLA